MPSPLYKDLPACSPLIVARLVAAGFTQAELADALGVSAGQVSRWAGAEARRGMPVEAALGLGTVLSRRYPERRTEIAHALAGPLAEACGCGVVEVERVRWTPSLTPTAPTRAASAAKSLTTASAPTRAAKQPSTRPAAARRLP